jgi:NADH:ubiquinone oxidoreductase subunit E
LLSFETVNCLGACAIGPVIMVNDDTYGNLDQAKVVKLLQGIVDRGGEGT